MTAAADRRGFLRSLVSLPLIGGGVTLIGQPTAAAVPVTRALLDSYETFLHFELRKLRWERFGPAGLEQPFGASGLDVVFRDRRTGKTFDYLSLDNAGAAFHEYGPTAPRASDRAAVVLSAVGCDWRARP